MKILFVSLGCDKNRVDTEVMLGMLASHGHSFTDDETQAEAAVVNTCCFIGDAKQESINVILEMAERRASGRREAPRPRAFGGRKRRTVPDHLHRWRQNVEAGSDEH